MEGLKLPLIPAVRAHRMVEQATVSETLIPGFHELVNKQGIFLFTLEKEFRSNCVKGASAYPIIVPLLLRT